MLHAPDCRERFAEDLAKELPRVPFASNFGAFAEARAPLAKLHLGYKTCDEYPLHLKYASTGEPASEHLRLGARSVRFADAGRTALFLNDYVRLSGIPAEAHEYVVDGRTPLEWFIDRYRVTRDKESRIVNDPYAWFDDPRDLVAAIRRIVHISPATACTVARLPAPFVEPEGTLP